MARRYVRSLGMQDSVGNTRERGSASPDEAVSRACKQTGGFPDDSVTVVRPTRTEFDLGTRPESVNDRVRECVLRELRSAATSSPRNSSGGQHVMREILRESSLRVHMPLVYDMHDILSTTEHLYGVAP